MNSAPAPSLAAFAGWFSSESIMPALRAEVLLQLDAERTIHDRHRNLVVAATCRNG